MPSQTATVGSKVGLHARPASRFVTAAVSSGIEVTIAREGAPAVDARSILSVMTLAAKYGETVVLETSGADEDKVLSQLVELVESELDG